MTFDIDRRTVTEGDVVEVKWQCDEAESVKLTIDNGYRSTDIPLETSGNNIGALKNAFENEAHSGNFSKKKEDNVTKMLLTVQTEKTNRVYMLNYSSNGHSYQNGKATIIVKVRLREDDERKP